MSLSRARLGHQYCLYVPSAHHVFQAIRHERVVPRTSDLLKTSSISDSRGHAHVPIAHCPYHIRSRGCMTRVASLRKRSGAVGAARSMVPLYDSSRLVFTLNDAGTKALAAATTTPSVTERSEGMFRLNGNDRASDDTRALVRAASDMRALPQFQKEVCDGRRNRPQWK